MSFQIIPDNTVLDETDSRELQKAVSYILDHTYLLSTSAFVTVTSELINVVKSTPQIASKVYL